MIGLALEFMSFAWQAGGVGVFWIEFLACSCWEMYYICATSGVLHLPPCRVQ
jgi:hypothetical protein